MSETTAFDYVNLENICRVCYRNDLSIHLASFEEITAIQTLTLEPYFTTMEPLYFCVYCSAILKKSVLFVKQCFRAHQLFLSTTKDNTSSKRTYNNMSIDLLDSISIDPPGLFNEEVKVELSVDDGVDGDHQLGDDHNGGADDLPLTMLRCEEELKTTSSERTSYNNMSKDLLDTISIDPVDLLKKEIKDEISADDEVTGDQDFGDDGVDDDDDLPLTMFKREEVPLVSMGVSKPEISTTTAADIQKVPADHRPPNAEGANGNGSAFTKRMVRETEQYLVIKLTKTEVLEELKDKLNSEKYLNSRYKCDKCAKEFNFEDVLRNHVDKHTKKKGFLICELCRQYFPSPVSLRGHMKSHTTRYKCKLCGVIKKSRQHLLEHYNQSHCADGARYTCDLCSFTTNKRTVIQRHTRTHAPTKRHICDICGRCCMSLQALRVHRIRHDKTMQFQCSSCPRRFVYRTLLKRHVREAHELAANYCVECDRTFTAKETLQNHFKKSKRHRNTPAYSCKLCSAKFETRSLLDAHRTWDHGEPVVTYQCDSCPKKYQCKDSLRAHIRRVHNKLVSHKRHTCNQCDKDFKEKHSLTRHLRTHTDTLRRRNTAHTKDYQQQYSQLQRKLTPLAV